MEMLLLVRASSNLFRAGIAKRGCFASIMGRRCQHSVSGKKLFLHDFHLEHKARMVDFAGYEMPIQYAGEGIVESHRHTREHVSIFDVSHMVQTKILGNDRIPFIESLVVSDIKNLKNNHSALTVFTHEDGGIIDDLIVSKTEDYLFLVSNAGCADKDIVHLKNQNVKFREKGADVDVDIICDRALLAIQGPGTMKVLQPVVSCNLKELTFMTTCLATVCGINDCRVTRCGYTGEDGVEISVPGHESRFIVENILKSEMDSVKLAGLGARDTLRLEAGLCLYGNDITEQRTPVEAGLTWTIGKRRRDEGGFPGSLVILEQIKNKPTMKRVGFISSGPCGRSHTILRNLNGSTVGEITSGCPSPCLKHNIGMGYVNSDSSKIGTKLSFDVHKTRVEAEIVKMPFVPSKYYVK